MFLALAASTAQATEAETRDALYELSAKHCIYHSKATVQPAVQALTAETLQILPKRQIVFCPNPKLGSNLAVVWYGEHKSIVWNPEVQGAVELLAKKLDEMSRNDQFPPGVEPWYADGTQPKPGTNVPGFDYAIKFDWQDQRGWYDNE